MRSYRSSRANRLGVVGLSAIGAIAALTVAACGSSPPSSSSPIGSPPVAGASSTPTPTPSSSSPSTSATSSSPTSSASPTTSAPVATGEIGAQCGMFPAKGSGSLKSMDTQQAVNAASSNPQLSVFIAALRTAGLDATLSARHAFTLMIPANSAFASVSKTTIIHLHNSGDLKKIVGYHAVNAQITPAQFAKGASYATFEGGSIKVSKSGSTYKVNGATVLCGNIRTANGTVYVINQVLLPPGVKG
jgi:uncharacterized surface protein with fasciclin (FAS1) repeats